ncbi:hypothetical protein QJS66_13775 [Kocuria rhizophila]|nr:hypothetical protein QJS66_13775 [Kocuria rhizophila]
MSRPRSWGGVRGTTATSSDQDAGGAGRLGTVATVLPACDLSTVPRWPRPGCWDGSHPRQSPPTATPAPATPRP